MKEGGVATLVFMRHQLFSQDLLVPKNESSALPPFLAHYWGWMNAALSIAPTWFFFSPSPCSWVGLALGISSLLK